MSYIKRSLLLLTVCALSSCNLFDNEKVEEPDLASEVAGTYLVTYESKDYTASDVLVEITKTYNDEVRISPPEPSDHATFKASVTRSSGDNLGLGVKDQFSEDLIIYGKSSSGLDGRYKPEDQSLVYTVIYEYAGVQDTAVVAGVRQ
ncbi:hypothetical protein [Marinoscillum sp.]|uniref:hypothetical protein n=1 Tax=Marinoscillum sp. TaxID=2024838 RepID=UPI003BAB3114